MFRHVTAALAASLLFALAPSAHAQQGHAGHHGPAQPTATAPSSRAFEEANARMHRDMSIALTGDADLDFVRSMIPHHQGAIDMARIVLAHGRDPAIRKLAEAIIAAQDSEIAMMRDWLRGRGR